MTPTAAARAARSPSAHRGQGNICTKHEISSQELLERARNLWNKSCRLEELCSRLGLQAQGQQDLPVIPVSVGV